MGAMAAIMMAGSSLQALGAVSQGNAAKAAHYYNASLREQDARVALEQASVDAWRVGQQGRFAQGELVAGLGAAGGSVEESMDVLRMSAANAKLDQETVLYRGRLKATGHYNDAALERQGGVVAERQGYLNAASALLTGAGQAGATHIASTKYGQLRRTA
jgi:hypothetical protein